MTEIPGFSVVPGAWAIVRLGPDDPAPEWANGGDFASVTRTAEELSIVCREEAIPPGVAREDDWSLVKLAGPFPLTATGILAAFLRPLAGAGVSVFVVSTFDTDYVLVRRPALARALEALEAAREERERRREERREEPND